MNRGGASAALLADGRLHLQHGPIDLIIEAWGQGQEIEAAYRQAASRFEDILEGRNPTDPFRDRPDIGAKLRAALAGKP